jgi:hypothetical protein
MGIGGGGGGGGEVCLSMQTCASILGQLMGEKSIPGIKKEPSIRSSRSRPINDNLKA